MNAMAGKRGEDRALDWTRSGDARFQHFSNRCHRGLSSTVSTVSCGRTHLLAMGSMTRPKNSICRSNNLSDSARMRSLQPSRFVRPQLDLDDFRYLDHKKSKRFQV